jgi:acetamidase/formamidase
MCYETNDNYVKGTKKIDINNRIHIDKLELKAADAKPGDIIEILFKVIKISDGAKHDLTNT